MNTRHSLGVALALALLGPITLSAQDPANKAFAALTTDSTAWQRVLVYTIGALSSQLVAGATDPTPQPWRIEVPSDDAQEQLIRTQLRTILRVRQAMPADTVVRSLEFGGLRILNDTARVEVRFDETRKSPGTGKTTGFGWSTTVLVPRDPQKKFWGAGRSRTTVAGDRAGC